MLIQNKVGASAFSVQLSLVGPYRHDLVGLILRWSVTRKVFKSGREQAICYRFETRARETAVDWKRKSQESLNSTNQSQ